jgi:hypothetical protein
VSFPTIAGARRASVSRSDPLEIVLTVAMTREHPPLTDDHIPQRAASSAPRARSATSTTDGDRDEHVTHPSRATGAGARDQ